MSSEYWSRYWTRRSSRRGVLAAGGVAAAGAASLALVGCGDDDDDDDGGSGGDGGNGGDEALYPTGGYADFTLEEMRTNYHPNKLKELPGHKSPPVYGGTSVQNIPAPLDYDVLGAQAFRLAAENYAHNQLIVFPAHDFVENANFLTLEASLAAKMPEQPDDLTYTFDIRKGVKFQNVPPVDGREMTAEDVQYAMEQYRKAPGQSPNFADVDTMTAIDDYTFQIKMKNPAAYLLAALAIPHHWIFSKEQHTSSEGLALKPIGTGPFIHESNTPQGPWRFVKNPDYWKKDERTGMQLPYFDAIEGVFQPTAAQQLASFRSGQLDTFVPTNFDAWVDLMGTNPEVITTFVTPAASFQPHFGMRLDTGAFTDPRLRRALSMLVDRDALIEELAGGMADYGLGVDFNYYGNEFPITPDNLGPYMQYNPDEARKLLDEIGGEFEFDIICPQFSGFNYETWIAVANMWNQAGIKTNIEAPQDAAQWSDQIFGNKYKHIFGWSSIGPGLDPDVYTYSQLYSKSTKNLYHFSDSKMDDLVTKQRVTLDREERQDILQEWLEYDLDLVTRIWTVLPYRIRARQPNIYNLADVSNAWIPGWASHGVEYGFKTA